MQWQGQAQLLYFVREKSTLNQTNAIAFRSERTGRHRGGRLGLGGLGRGHGLGGLSLGGLSFGGLGLFSWLLLVPLLESCLELSDEVVEGTDCWRDMSVLSKT